MARETVKSVNEKVTKLMGKFDEHLGSHEGKGLETGIDVNELKNEIEQGKETLQQLITAVKADVKELFEFMDYVKEWRGENDLRGINAIIMNQDRRSNETFSKLLGHEEGHMTIEELNKFREEIKEYVNGKLNKKESWWKRLWAKMNQ